MKQAKEENTMDTPTNNQVAQLPEDLRKRITNTLDKYFPDEMDATMLHPNMGGAVDGVMKILSQTIAQRERSVREEGRKQGVAQAVSFFMNKLTNLSQEVLLEALQSEQKETKGQNV